MADVKREIERKYEAAPGIRLPDLTGVAGTAASVPRGVVELDAVYYDTEDFRLAAGSITLRRRTGGDDEGWHVKFPVAPGVRDEIRAPLTGQLPDALAGLIRSRVRDRAVVPVVRLLSSRDVHHLTDAGGRLLAELSVDTVLAERLTGDGAGTTAGWTEIEVELADDVDPAYLDAVEERLAAAGVRPSTAASKAARALAETAPAPSPGEGPEPSGREPGAGESGIAGEQVLARVRRQTEAIVTLDPAVRRDLPDAVHRMRVATRRLRSAFKSYREVLDRAVTDPVGAELKWLAAELGTVRDHEVLEARLLHHVDEVEPALLLGPVRGRLERWGAAERTAARRRTLAVLDGDRYLALLGALDALLADPPLLPAAGEDAAGVLARAALKDHDRLTARVHHALDLPPGHDRDLAMHEARKAAKRTRYAGEAARPVLGKPAKRLAKRVKAVQSLLGDHQDGVVAREALRALAVHAHGAGESAFTWGLLYGREEAAAARLEHRLPHVWARASEARLRAALKS
ncbi:CYTH and CHAD domain-containing protein [Streptomyces sp. NBC_00102]|uniref:CYTH and CHAD domain-containing protein n=1 Tax=Streptomyces sp. NBC_00102 TaxID=2975652 RepID=UPI002253FAB2|nr:CYTH and CHAD domain-containing protein [Streptomyces sp. NBC_00102]MCX5397003.1 CYTH and CHAD domain-containing protein [Streptomyces sp. NBC_00102]